MSPEAQAAERRRRHRRNVPKLFAIVAGVMGILATHTASVPEEYRPLIELASQITVVVGAILFDYHPLRRR